MKRFFLLVLTFLLAEYSYGQVESHYQIKRDSIVLPFPTVYISRRAGPSITPVGIQPIVQEMMLYDGWREKKIRWSNCRIPYPKQSITPRLIILDGVPAEIGYREISFQPNETPQHTLMPLTHRIDEKQKVWVSPDVLSMRRPLLYTPYF